MKEKKFKILTDDEYTALIKTLGSRVQYADLIFIGNSAVEGLIIASPDLGIRGESHPSLHAFVSQSAAEFVLTNLYSKENQKNG